MLSEFAPYLSKPFVDENFAFYGKTLTGAQELTTRSWEHDSPPNHEALVITTYRKADGTPSQHSADTSTMIYSLTKMAG